MEFLTTENRDTTLFSITAWSLWNRRNNLRLGKATVVLSQVLKQSKERMLEFSQHPNHTPPSSVYLQHVGDPLTSHGLRYISTELYSVKKRGLVLEW